MSFTNGKPKSKKQATKGLRQILEDNQSCKKFYRDLILGVNAIYLLVMVLLFDMFSTTNITLFVLSTAIYFCSYQLLTYISKPTYKEGCQGQVNALEYVQDLNEAGGIAEQAIDAVILTLISQGLALISSWFWLLLLLGPLRGFYLLQKHVLAPYFFQSQEQAQPEVDEKKQRKLERKMRRNQN